MITKEQRAREIQERAAAIEAALAYAPSADDLHDLALRVATLEREKAELAGAVEAMAREREVEQQKGRGKTW